MEAENSRAAFLKIQRTANNQQYKFPVAPEDCVGPEGASFMFGGVGMAIGLLALEARLERPVVWGTCQYLGPAAPGQALTLDVSAPRVGKNLIQAQVDAVVDSNPIYRLTAVLGSGRESFSYIWRKPPKVPPPECVDTVTHWRGSGGLHSRFEVRPVNGRFGTDRLAHPEPEGRLTMWVRPYDALIDLSCLATLADYVPAGIGNALGLHAGGRSLDNTFRLVGIPETQWVLVDVQIDVISDGLVHGQIALYSDRGELMAIGSQSLMLVFHNPIDSKGLEQLKEALGDISR